MSRLIVVEGVDGTGKSTQIELLKEVTENAIIFKYPTSKYKTLNDYLEKKAHVDSKALFLLFLADIADDQQNVKKALDQGKTVILDRYVFSTLAYEVDGISHNEGKKIIESVGYLKPDLVILLDISAEESQRRKKKQKELDRYEENINYLEKVRSNFAKLCEERFLTTNWHMIDANRDIRTIHSDIMSAIK
ncbi:dTMP kinase [Candidatus Micrarchaeota archaeon]|nr:dTMP kinase [Candidatus Micrarchaeota archaeon]MBU1165718.1 dTMP kinase [Candidatus Micrarchaeota archaeon]MBU1887085.1 dTMP kinase [Candidatus Micrarchaeota archaeon]